MVHGGVVGDLEQPRAEARVAAEALQAVEGAKERVLCHVLGVRRPHDARGDAHHHVSVTVHQLLEGPEVTAEAVVDEYAVGVHVAPEP